MAELPVPDGPYTVAEYQALVRSGILDHVRNELLESWIMTQAVASPMQAATISLAHSAIRDLLSPEWRVRIRSGVTFSDSEPEPDLAIILGPARRYMERHPGPGDIAFLVECADVTLERDQTVKCRVYARAAIPVYWIVNLVDRRLEVYTDPTGPDAAPRYRQRQEYRNGDSVPLVIGGQEVGRIAVADILP